LEGDRKPSSVSLPVDRDEGHFSRALIAQGLKRPHPPRLSPKDRENLNGLFSPPRVAGEQGLFGLAPGGVYQATSIARGTGGLLPRLFNLTLWNRRSAIPQGGMFSVALSLPCEGGVAATSQGSPRYGPPCPMELGLSSP
jgi:hypothetical protein